jgi:DNA-binding CsgD family transcriptional regulator
MRNGFQTLTEREKETLRLLLAGHDAKSIARAQGLSVHTVNERLRDARRKLDVTSSREAARILAAAERLTPDCLTDKDFGVVGSGGGVGNGEQRDRRPGTGHRLAWLGGGMLIMSMLIAAVALSMVQGGDARGTDQPTRPVSAAMAPGAPQSPESGLAREWVALLDNQQWEQSWQTASVLLKSQIKAAQWAASVQPVREPLGAVSSRVVQSATRSNSLPGAPAGEYETIQFHTDFARKRGAVETVVLAREGPGWKVAGYFVR